MLYYIVVACPNGLTVEYMPWMLCLFEETPVVEGGKLVLLFDKKEVTRLKA